MNIGQGIGPVASTLASTARHEVMELIEYLDHEGDDDTELEGEAPECVNWWLCESWDTLDLLDFDEDSLSQAITQVIKELDPLLSKRRTEQGNDLEDLFSDKGYADVEAKTISSLEAIECLEDEPPSEEDKKCLGLLDTYKMCAIRNQSGRSSWT